MEGICLRSFWGQSFTEQEQQQKTPNAESESVVQDDIATSGAVTSLKATTAVVRYVDKKEGDEALSRSNRLLLHARALEFTHPITKAKMKITAACPF